MIDNNKVVKKLGEIIDPNTGKDIIASKRISNLKIDGNNILFTLVGNDLDPQIKAQLNSDIYGSLKNTFPEAEIHIHMHKICRC